MAWRKGGDYKAFLTVFTDVLEIEYYTQSTSYLFYILSKPPGQFPSPIELTGITGWLWHHTETMIAWYQRKYEAQLNCSKKELSLSLWSNRDNTFSGRRSWQTWLCLRWVRAETLFAPCWLIKEKSYVVEISKCYLPLIFLFLLGTEEGYMSMPR